MEGQRDFHREREDAFTSIDEIMLDIMGSTKRNNHEAGMEHSQGGESRENGNEVDPTLSMPRNIRQRISQQPAEASTLGEEDKKKKYLGKGLDDEWTEGQIKTLVMELQYFSCAPDHVRVQFNVHCNSPPTRDSIRQQVEDLEAQLVAEIPNIEEFKRKHKMDIMEYNNDVFPPSENFDMEKAKECMEERDSQFRDDLYSIEIRWKRDEDRIDPKDEEMKKFYTAIRVNSTAFLDRILYLKQTRRYLLGRFELMYGLRREHQSSSSSSTPGANAHEFLEKDIVILNRRFLWQHVERYGGAQGFHMYKSCSEQEAVEAADGFEEEKKATDGHWNCYQEWVEGQRGGEQENTNTEGWGEDELFEEEMANTEGGGEDELFKQEMAKKNEYIKQAYQKLGASPVFNYPNVPEVDGTHITHVLIAWESVLDFASSEFTLILPFCFVSLVDHCTLTTRRII